MVDEEDYAWAAQFGWNRKWSRGDRKFYLRRAVTIIIGPDYKCEQTGKRIQNRRVETLLLHVAIITQRMGLVQPTPKHIVGHLDDDAMNCRRSNLKWLTQAENVAMTFRKGLSRKPRLPVESYG